MSGYSPRETDGMQQYVVHHLLVSLLDLPCRTGVARHRHSIHDAAIHLLGEIMPVFYSRLGATKLVDVLS